jgi:hypothetical protein
MLQFVPADPSPLAQTAVYLAGILAGYGLLTGPEEWKRAWTAVRSTWSRRSD